MGQIIAWWKIDNTQSTEKRVVVLVHIYVSWTQRISCTKMAAAEMWSLKIYLTPVFPIKGDCIVCGYNRYNQFIFCWLPN